MSKYGETLEVYENYYNYNNIFLELSRKKKDKTLKNIFLKELKSCFNTVNVTEINTGAIQINNLFIFYNNDKLGEPLLHIKKLNIQRLIFFYLMTFLLCLFYILIIFSSLELISTIISFDDILIIPEAIFILIVSFIFYSMILSLVTIKLNNWNEGLKNFIKNKNNLFFLLFPFHKLTTDIIGIHFVIGTKGLFIYSELNTGNLYNTYTYSRITKRGDIYNNAFKKLLNDYCKKKIFELAKKYYSS